MQPDWEDLDLFFDDFAVAAVIHRASGGSVELPVIYDDAYLNAQIGEYEFDTQGHRALCRADRVVGVKPRDTIEISGRHFDILTHPQPDGTGLALLKLAEVP